jgi:hypothetical protein
VVVDILIIIWIIVCILGYLKVIGVDVISWLYCQGVNTIVWLYCKETGRILFNRNTKISNNRRSDILYIIYLSASIVRFRAHFTANILRAARFDENRRKKEIERLQKEENNFLKSDTIVDEWSWKRENFKQRLRMIEMESMKGEQNVQSWLDCIKDAVDDFLEINKVKIDCLAMNVSDKEVKQTIKQALSQLDARKRKDHLEKIEAVSNG